MLTNWKASRRARRLCAEANHYRDLINLVYQARRGNAQPLADIDISFTKDGPFHLSPEIEIQGVRDGRFHVPYGEYLAFSSKDLAQAMQHLPAYRHIGARLERHPQVLRLQNAERERLALEHPPRKKAKQYCAEANQYLHLLQLVWNESDKKGQPLADIGVTYTAGAIGMFHIAVQKDGMASSVRTPLLGGDYSHYCPSEVRAATLALPTYRMLAGLLEEHPMVSRARSGKQQRQSAEQAEQAEREKKRQQIKQERRREEKRIKREALAFKTDRTGS